MDRVFNFLILCFSVIISLLLIEIFLFFYLKNYKNFSVQSHRIELAKKNNTNFDIRSKLNVYQDLDKKTHPKSIIYTNYRDSDHLQKKLNWHLGQLSHAYTIYCNESGFYTSYKSDRYGFNNEDNLWNLKEINSLLIGDSFIHGACVNNENNISNQLINKGITNINLGLGGSGPLEQLAILKEYLKLAKPKNIIYFYYEDNDLKDLALPVNSNLQEYIDHQNFSQNIALKQNIIDYYVLQNFRNKIKFEKNNNYFHSNFQSQITKKDLLKSILRLFEVRQILNNFLDQNIYLSKNNIVEHNTLVKFEKVFSEIKRYTHDNNAELIVVYLPSYRSFNNIFFDHSIKKKIKTIFNKEKYFLDIERIFKESGDPKQYFPFRFYGHYNNEGYKLISTKIIEILN